MKSLPSALALALALLAITLTPARAASDADVTLLKVEKVTITETTITIVVSEAKTTITLIRDDYDPAYTGDNWHGMPVTRTEVISNKATFTIQKPPGNALPEAWQDTLKNAKDLQNGQPVGRIGYYAPDIVIKGNMIASITGSGYLYPGGK